MSFFYSKSTGGFYDHAIHGDNVPADAVEITADEHAALLVGQSQGRRIVADMVGRPMLADQPAATTGDVWARIKAKRDAIKAGGVMVGSKWYHTDEASRIQYLALLKMAEQAAAGGASGASALQHGGAEIRWKTMDGTFVPMTMQLAQDVFTAVAGLDFAAFGVAETHRAAMEAAANPAVYDFSGGWPETFGG
ncbi:DUF4376 domain-containing protein [Burkholderia stabilis]